MVALDGAFITVDPDSILRDLKTEDILSIQIVCMDPQDSTFNRTHGIPVMLVRTKEGPASYVKRQLAAILAAQDAHFRRESTYISDLSRIALPFRAAQLRVSIDVRAKGWLAKATVEQSSLVCFVFSGDIRPPHPRLLPGRPDCNEDREALP
ncbi:MAG: hypothetical protein ACREMA_01655 [Longimicrobiales bacterium]